MKKRISFLRVITGVLMFILFLQIALFSPEPVTTYTNHTGQTLGISTGAVFAVVGVFAVIMTCIIISIAGLVQGLISIVAPNHKIDFFKWIEELKL